MKSILILNARIINEGRIFESDLLVKAGRIARIAKDLQSSAADTVIDAAGKLLMPGLIDDQVHFREPGLTDKGDIASESRAAVAGGVTSFMEMPNTRPPTLNADLLEWKYARAAQTSPANYSFYMGASNDNIEAVKKADPRTICGVKVFMGSSTGNMLVDDAQTLNQIFAHSPMLIATHCEDDRMIAANAEKLRAEFGDDVPVEYHPLIRSAEACYASSSLAVELAKKHRANLHILHISTAMELDLFSNQALADKHITSEACVHHLFFCDEDYRKFGTRIKCNPAIKSADDRAALRQAVLDNKIDVIATDHAPHTLAEKNNTYFKAPSGLPLVQHSLQMLMALHHHQIFPLELIVQKTSHAVADRFRIIDRGYIREGYWADLVLVDPHAAQTVKKDNLLYHCQWSPLEDYTFGATVTATIVSGHLAWYNGRINEGQSGHRLQFDRPI